MSTFRLWGLSTSVNSSVSGMLLIGSFALGCSDPAATTGGGDGGNGGMSSSSSSSGGSACGPNQQLCGETCTDTQLDPAHCGGCNNACATGEVCSAGTCALVCGGGTTQCGSSCVNVASDPLHCGACNNACASGEVCSQGMCSLQCAGGSTLCGQACVDLLIDANNCGACGSKCFPGNVCSMGMCGLQCNGGTTQCGSKCVNTASDPSHCGACDNACGPYPDAIGACAGGTCLMACNAGRADCNGTVNDGCESNLSSDANNCGFCGNACPDGNNATKTCANNTCSLTCNGNFKDCNNDLTDGCESDTQTNLSHCGACGAACAPVANATVSCAMGTCGFTCSGTFADCNNNPADGCEINKSNNAAHCGMCGMVCAAGQACVNSMCVASNLPPLNGTQTVNISRGTTHNAFFSDPVTGKIYWHQSYIGNQVTEFPNIPNFVANTNGKTITLAQQFEGTYHAALNGFIYYAIYNTNTMAKASAVDGQIVASATLTGAGFHNQSAWQWGGYSDICFYTDSGNLLYVLYAPPSNGNIQIGRLDPNTLALQQTWTVPRAKLNTGYGFLVNGTFYFGNQYTSPAINAKFNLATNTYDTTYTNSLTPVMSEYITDTYWDAFSKSLLEVSNSYHLVYPNVQ